MREDGRMLKDVDQAQVKASAESKRRWHYRKIIRTVPGAEAFRPRSESANPLVHL